MIMGCGLGLVHSHKRLCCSTFFSVFFKPTRLQKKKKMEFTPWSPDFMTHRMHAMSRRFWKEYDGPDSLADDAYKRTMESAWVQEQKNAHTEGFLKAVKERSYIKYIQKGSQYFVTINPKPDTSIETLVKLTDKWVRQKYIQEAKWSYEQTSDTIDKAGYHPHVHAIIDVDTNRKNVLDRTYNTFKHVCGGLASVDIKYAHGNSETYLQGDKKDKNKQQKVLVDIYWRNINNLKELYIIKDGILQEEIRDTQANTQDIQT